MRVFVCFGYNERDRWVRDLVLPLVAAFGHEVVTGEDLYHDGRIQPGVEQRILRSDAVIGFRTQRSQLADGQWSTHDWVTEELTFAHASGIAFLEVREVGVDPQGGLIDGFQRLNYSPDEMSSFLVKFAQILGAWPRPSQRVQLVIDHQDELIPLLNRDGFRCVYRLDPNGAAPVEIPARIQPIKGGLFIDVKIKRDTLIQVEITFEERTWSSYMDSVEWPSIRLIAGRGSDD